MDNITISMEEYKELLIIKGRYEELKQNNLNKTINVDSTVYKPYTLCRAECTE